MNAEELQQLVDRVEADEEASRPPAGLLERARRDSRRRRSVAAGLLVGAAAASVAVAVVVPRLVDGGLSQPPSAIDVPPSPSADRAPDTLRVTCTTTGPEVSSTTVAARSDGVRLEVVTTMPPGGYLTYASAGANGGDPASRASGTYAFPPGEVVLDCVSPPGMDETRPVSVEVVDPGGFWRDTTLDDLGCSGGPIVEWVGGLERSADSERAAVDGALDAYAAETGRRLDASPADLGYVDADVQTWLGTEDGTPKLSFVVTRSGTGWTARPDTPCPGS